jgi:hypothetical protein
MPEPERLLEPSDFRRLNADCVSLIFGAVKAPGLGVAFLHPMKRLKCKG